MPPQSRIWAIVLILLQAVPTVAFFGSQALGAPQSVVSLAVAPLAGLIIAVLRRRHVGQDAIWLGCNLHFLFAGPVIWALYLTGQKNAAAVLLEWVLLGVPAFVFVVLAVRAVKARTTGPILLAGVAFAGLIFAAFHHDTYQLVIAVPLGAVFWTGLVLRWRGGAVTGLIPLGAVLFGADEVAEI